MDANIAAATMAGLLPSLKNIFNVLQLYSVKFSNENYEAKFVVIRRHLKSSEDELDKAQSRLEQSPKNPDGKELIVTVKKLTRITRRAMARLEEFLEFAPENAGTTEFASPVNKMVGEGAEMEKIKAILIF